jgi:MYXO-CTERM domain-containing protein
MRKLAAFITVALIGLSQINDAYACTCLPPPPVATAVADASAVFAGRILEVTDPAGPGDDMIARFAITRVWKGPTDRTEIEIRTAANSAACGLSFEEDDTWLIYADSFEGNLTASLCSRSKPLSVAQEDLAELGPGSVPGGPGPMPPGPRGCNCDMTPEQGAPWGAIAILGVAGAVAARRRRRLSSH